jgi:hypothetical protein
MAMQKMAAPSSAPMPEMPQDEAAEGSEAPAEGGGGGSVSDLIVGLDAGLAKLNDLMQSAQGVDPDMKKSMDSVLQSYRGLVQGLLGQAPGEKAAPGGAQGSAPMESGGKAGVVPAY